MDNATKTLRKKRMITAIVIVFAISLVGLIFLLVEDRIGENKPSGTEETTLRPLLAIPNWDENIFADEEWLDKNRYITYVEGGVSTTITDGVYDSYNICVDFMALYFEVLMQGNAEALCGFYDESYFDNNYKWDEITMQRVYDIKLEQISVVDTATHSEYVYKVSYKIMKNDGTFRNDVKSDGERPQFYTIVDDGTYIKITDVSYSYIPK